MDDKDKILITKEDGHRHATIADLKRVSEEIRQGVNYVAFQLQQAIIQAEGRYTVAWNATNAILKALLDKKLIMEADIVTAGKELYDEAQAYQKAKIEEAKLKKEGVSPISPVTMDPTPLEKLNTTTFKEGV